MSDISTKALLNYSQVMSKIHVSASQLTTEINKIEAASIKMMQSSIATTNAMKNGYDAVTESIKRTQMEMEKLNKPVKLSIDCGGLRSSVQRCLESASFKIKCECVGGSGGPSSSGGPGRIEQTIISSALGSAISYVLPSVVSRLAPVAAEAMPIVGSFLGGVGVPITMGLFDVGGPFGPSWDSPEGKARQQGQQEYMKSRPDLFKPDGHGGFTTVDNKEEKIGPSDQDLMNPAWWKNGLDQIAGAPSSFANWVGKMFSGIKLPEFKWPTAQDILNFIKSKLGIKEFKIPTLSDITNWIKSRLPQNLKFPTLGEIISWIKSKMPSWLHFPSLPEISGWIKSHMPSWLHFPSWEEIKGWIQSHMPSWLHFPSPSKIIEWIQKRIWSWVPGQGSSGPSSPGSGIGGGGGKAFGPSPTQYLSIASGNYGGFKYLPYGGIGQSIGTTLATMSGNCVDGTLAQLALASAFGIPAEMVTTTWNGNPHVYGRINGVDRDIANHALTGSWSHPPAGPDLGNNQSTVIKQEKHYHFEGANFYGDRDFKNKIRKVLDEETTFY